VLVHSIVNKPDDLVFDANRAFRCCLLCGDVYQNEQDRLPHDKYTPEIQYLTSIAREEWARNHAKEHTIKEHEDFRMSMRFCTPTAATKLVPLGIAPVSDMVLSDEHRLAALEAPRLSTQEVQS